MKIRWSPLLWGSNRIHWNRAFDYIWLILSNILRRFIVDLPGYKCPALGVTRFCCTSRDQTCLILFVAWQARSWARLALRKCSASLCGAKPLPFQKTLQEKKTRRRGISAFPYISDAFSCIFHMSHFTFLQILPRLWAISDLSNTRSRKSARLSSNVKPGYGNLWAKYI